MKKLEFFFKNIFLNLLLLFNSKKKNAEFDFNSESSKILFIRLNRIGDALVVTPLLHVIKTNLKSKIYVLADKKNFIAFNNNPDIDSLLIFDKDFKGFLKVLKFIRTENIQTVADLHDDISTTVSFLIAMCNAKNKFGLEKENKKIYTKTVARLDSSQHHVVDRILELARLFNIEPDNREVNILYSPSQHSIKKIDEYLYRKFPLRKMLVGINISAGSQARFWGINNYRKLIDFFSQLDLNYVLISSPEEKTTADKICEDESKLFSSENYDEFAALLSKLDLLFTPDTAAVHLASAYKVPVFGIYVRYKTQDMIWSPYKSKFDCVITEESNLSNVTFEEVKAKLEKFLLNFNLIAVSETK